MKHKYNKINQETEIKFLLYCLGLTKDENPPANFLELPKEKWRAILDKADQHSILSLLYYQLTQSNKDIQIPSNILKLLKHFYFQSSLENSQVFCELAKMIKEAKNNNISVIVLKGASIAGSVYPKIALRPMSDLDLLVKSEDIQGFHELLLKLGWNCLQSEDSLENYIKRDLPLGYKKYELVIDLHPKIEELPILEPWTNSIAIKIDSNDTLALGPDDLLLFQCVHLYKHVSNDYLVEIIKLYDIVLILRKYHERFNWDYIIQYAYANQCEHIIHCILDFIRTEFGEDISADVLSKLKSDKFTINFRDVLYKNKKLPAIVYGARQITYIICKISSLFLIPKSARIRDVIRDIFGIIFPSKDYLIVRYSIHPTWLYFIYYLIRFPIGGAKILKVIYNNISSSITNHLKRQD